MKNSVGSYKIRGVVELFRLYRSKSIANNQSDPSFMVAAARQGVGVNNNGFGNTQLTGLRLVHAASYSSSGNDGGSSSSPLPKPPSLRPPAPPGRGRFPMWFKLVIGSVFSLLLAFWTPKWAALLKIGGEAEVVIKEVEQAAVMVEKAATVMEKVSEEVADNLPNGNKFKETALIVEHVSKEAAKDAHIAEEILHKVDVVKHDAEIVEEMIEPINETIEHNDKFNEGVKS
ncbi:uncharacterized protein LOC141646362 isoform X2 [Silene latifolia]|uniref:uncharacterized protein LOC141646362 isoform X2 n=1 Tax=Silene latifolia TaxID=37657 RepID=UPI003D77EB74